MDKGMPGSVRARRTPLAPTEGRLSAPDARTELDGLATRRIIEEALVAESRDALGGPCPWPIHPADAHGRLRSSIPTGMKFW